MMTNGKLDFAALFNHQLAFQALITGEKSLPKDSVRWFSYHVQAMVEEMGEVLRADKRWKTHRNVFYDENNKMEEIADIFITALNLAIFSGLDARKLYDIVFLKMEQNIKNKDRVEGEILNENKNNRC